MTTEAAMRAAEALLPNIRPRDDAKIIATAEIIDREFAELVRQRDALLAACIQAEAALSQIYDCRDGHSAIQCRAAIALCQKD